LIALILMLVDINASRWVLFLGETNAECSIQFPARKNAISDVLLKVAWMLFTVNCFQQKEGEYGADAVRDAQEMLYRAYYSKQEECCLYNVYCS
jgi:hypothetical protein